MVDPAMAVRAREAFGHKERSYQPAGKVGEGTYGNVYKASCKNQKDTWVAIKNYKSQGDSDDGGVPVTAIAEITLLRELDHPNVIRLVDAAINPDGPFIYMVYDYMGQDLERLMNSCDRSRQPPQQFIKKVMWDLLQGIDYLHKSWIIHRDIKPGNILMDTKTCTAKLADFGMARIVRDPLKKLGDDGRVVTIWWRAPELLLGAQHYTGAIDVWAIGCIFFELLFGRPPMKCNDEHNKFQQAAVELLFTKLGTPTEANWPSIKQLPFYPEIADWPVKKGDLYNDPSFKQLDPKAKDLLMKMLEFDPSRRITAEVALKHPYWGGDKPKPFNLQVVFPELMGK
eukprot:TRINITY_DN66449_c1_g6_i1.p1 TRINITY_DN66449_c1_g6~~TRINITY_DN66449_c1_g6_i1.p1  ORF type:complete len:341 (-),score=28.67 TRINITY_DN66449_c1_g6_i1:150-1172(-)